MAITSSLQEAIEKIALEKLNADIQNRDKYKNFVFSMSLKEILSAIDTINNEATIDMVLAATPSHNWLIYNQIRALIIKKYHPNYITAETKKFIEKINSK